MLNFKSRACLFHGLPTNSICQSLVLTTHVPIITHIQWRMSSEMAGAVEPVGVRNVQLVIEKKRKGGVAA